MNTLNNTEYLPFHRPSFDHREIEAVIDVMRSGWLTTGTKAHEFEREFAKFLGARYALAVNSCTAGLHLALEAAGVRAGDEVLLPTLTFTATAEVVTYLGARPVLIDSEPDFYNLDPDALEAGVTRRTKAIIPVHFAGQPCDMDAINAIAQRHGLAVIEDAAHAFPARYKGRFVGTLSPLTAFSFYATKTLATGEGGMVVTNDQHLAERIALMRLHGMSKDAWKRYQQQGTWRYDVLAPGFKYNLPDLQAAIGLVQLQKAESLRCQRERIAQRYAAELGDEPALRLPNVSSDVQHAWHLYVINLLPGSLTIGRDAVIQELANRGIGCSVHFIPLHLHSYYRQTYGYGAGQFPVADAYFEGCISLPIYPDMTEGDVSRVVAALRDVTRKFGTRAKSVVNAGVDRELRTIP